MTLMTPEQFEESLKNMNPRVYMNGKRVENVLENPNTRTVVESNKASYRWALDPGFICRMRSWEMWPNSIYAMPFGGRWHWQEISAAGLW